MLLSMLVREKLESLLAARGWKPPRLAQEIGEHPNWVYDRISGRIAIKADEIVRVAGALGISTCDFYEEEKPEFVSPATDALARHTAAVTAEAMRSVIREEVRKALGDQAEQVPGRLPRLDDTSTRYGAGRQELADTFAREMVRAWGQLSEEKQRRILEIVEGPD